MQSPNIPRKATMLRLDPDLYARVQAIAQRENRSVNQQIIYYIRRGLEAAQKQETGR